MWRTGSTVLAWKPEALTHTCVSSTWVAFWSKQSNFPHVATNTEAINSKGFMKLLLTKENKLMSKIINVEKSRLWENTQKPHHRFLKFSRKIQTVHFQNVWIGFSSPSHNHIFFKHLCGIGSDQNYRTWSVTGDSCKWILDGSLSNSNITYTILNTKVSRQ